MNLSAPSEKIFRDMWSNRARAILVIVTIAIGIAAVGLIHNTVSMMKRDLFGQFSSINPASVRLYTSPIQKDLIETVKSMEEVSNVQARRLVNAKLVNSSDQLETLNISIVPDFSNIAVYTLTTEQGESSPGYQQILLERSTAAGLKLELGDRLTVEMDGGQRFTLTVSGIVHDMSSSPYNIDRIAAGYISMSTLEWLGEPAYYNVLDIIVSDNKTNREHVLQVAAQVRDQKIEPAGNQVMTILIPGTSSQPGEFWAHKQVDGMLLVLQIMSILAIFLSAGLVLNTVSAILVQQTRQIGIMRSVGATRRQIIGMYLAYVFVLSIIGLIIALPLGLLGSWGLTGYAAKFLNFNVSKVNLPPNIFLLQVGMGLLMPVGIALFPILRGTRISVYNAIYQLGTENQDKRGWIDRHLVKFRLLSPPVLLSLRNTFRNKSRLLFTLITLTVAGVMFIAVFSSYATLEKQIMDLGRYIAFDASISIPTGINRYTANYEALRVPGVQYAEGWASANASIVFSNGSESDSIEVVGLPYDSKTIQPKLLKGRWLRSEDTWQAVVSEDILTIIPDLKVGDEINIKIDDHTLQYEVVGITSKNWVARRIYIDYKQFSKLANRYNQVNTVRVLSTPGAFSSAIDQDQIGKELEQRFEKANLSTSSSQTRHKIFAYMSDAFRVLLIVLLLVAGILVIIGGLGLSGTMGLNILERTREVGVLRAVGASNHSIRQVVIVEGVVVALLSWALSAMLSPGVGILLANAVVRVAFGTQPVFQYSILGLLSWLCITILIGVFSSLTPAHNAARLTVREVLNYE